MYYTYTVQYMWYVPENYISISVLILNLPPLCCLLHAQCANAFHSSISRMDIIRLLHQPDKTIRGMIYYGFSWWYFALCEDETGVQYTFSCATSETEVEFNFESYKIDGFNDVAVIDHVARFLFNLLLCII
jgi:hypothetical protein